MSHHQEGSVICPNCGYAAEKNYCAQCGQETHLHKETFIGMIFHFVAHYFHYDSKFWQTLRTLVTRPGRLTIDYIEKKRARHIPPISLYIFASAVFFLLFFSLRADHDKLLKSAKKTMSSPAVVTRLKDTTEGPQLAKVASTVNTDTVKNNKEPDKPVFDGPDGAVSFVEGLMHALPKMFFFLIPLMAFVLTILFARRKNAYFVNHSVFSLHIHSFIFLIGILIILPSGNIRFLSPVIDIIQNILFASSIVYLVIAMRNVYKISTLRSVFYSIIITIIYFIFFLLIAGIFIGYKIYQMQPESFHT